MGPGHVPSPRNPTRRVPVLRWRITPWGGPASAFWVSAVASMASLLALLRIASDNLAFAAALVVGWVATAMLVQAVVLQRHNKQVSQCS